MCCCVMAWWLGVQDQRRYAAGFDLDGVFWLLLVQ
uniref:Uncharacterized protein n=1 Tax=Arundo donax TaxID=35708 RepID=A0A0A8ZD59_ARUDO